MHACIVRSTLFGALLLLAACGGGGDGGMAPVQNAMVGGFWTGTLTVNGTAYSVYAMSAENGAVELIESDDNSSFGAQYWGTISAVGNQVSVTFSGAVLDPSAPFADGSLRGTGTASGTINQRSSIAATISFTTSNSPNSPISGQLALTYDASYAQASSLTTISGNFTSVAGPLSDSLSITTGGGLTYTDPTITQCLANGTVAIIDARYAVYAVEMTFSNCSGIYADLNGVNISGLGGIDTSQSPTLLLFLLHGMVSGTDSPFPLPYQST
jgi:hypothetical protein